MSIAHALSIILHGTAEVTPRADLEKKLASGKILKVKLGMDPTAPDLHLGHAVVLTKMREFQDLGHQAILIIGDFTAQIGDPTGRSKTRPPLTHDAILHNQTTYLEQAGKILDTNTLQIVCNGQWLGTLSFSDIVKLCAKITLARIIEREDFQKRMTAQQPIGLHELLYPLMQGYDSVFLHADIELGGTDQTFNLLVGRFLQEQFGQEPQVVLTMPLLEGIDGVQKMSKSYGNAIGIAEPPDQAFGKLMSISDTSMWHYLLLLANYQENKIKDLQKEVANGSVHPMKLKKEMAHAIITRFWSADQATHAQQQFEALFQDKDYSKAIEFELPANTEQPIWIVDLLKLLGAIETSSQAKRLIESNAISIDGVVITDFKATITCTPGMIIKAGKHSIYKINI
jgi:tyrosyl-tRNA synthetase